ncbi:MAG TPA: ATP-binding protein [Burkholderiales bacterium]|nr:ATP-binding protein [Burkholderiales bacterium]
MASSADAGESPDFRVLFESVPGLYLVLTPDFTIVAASDAYLRATLMTRDDLLGRGFFDVFPDSPDDPDADGRMNLRASLKRVVSQQTPDALPVQKYDIRRSESQRGFEERYWSPVNSPVFSKDGTLAYIIHRVEDVTEFVRLTQQSGAQARQSEALRSRVEKMEAETLSRTSELAEANQDLRKTHEELKSALRELEGFSYSVSHDLRSPLRAIEGFARILEEEHVASLDEEGRRLLRIIRDGGAKMGRLIDGLLGFSRLGKQPLALAAVDMDLLVSEVVAELRLNDQQSPKRVVVQVLPAAYGDLALLRLVWINLLSNAAKYTGTRKQPRIQVTGMKKGTEIVYSVADNGVGFDMQYAGKLFGVFQRLHADEEFPGIGVGLSFVQRIVNRHGGRVWAEGAVDKGATFFFALPIENLPRTR